MYYGLYTTKHRTEKSFLLLFLPFLHLFLCPSFDCNTHIHTDRVLLHVKCMHTNSVHLASCLCRSDLMEHFVTPACRRRCSQHLLHNLPPVTFDLLSHPRTWKIETFTNVLTLMAFIAHWISLQDQLSMWSPPFRLFGRQNSLMALFHWHIM